MLDLAILDQGVARALAEPDRLRYWVAEFPLEQRPPDHRPDRHHPRVERLAERLDLVAAERLHPRPTSAARAFSRLCYRHIHDQALASSNVIGLRLYVENNNLRAQQTYQALGMKPGGYSVLEELWLDRSQLE